MTSSPAEFVCVAGGKVGGHEAEAVIYHATGKLRGTPAYFLPASAVQGAAQEPGLKDALSEFAKNYLPESLQDKLGVGTQQKWGRMALADPNHNPLKLNRHDGLNLVYDRHGKLKDCYIANDLMAEPDFTTPIDVQAKPPSPAAPAPAATPSLAPAR